MHELLAVTAILKKEIKSKRATQKLLLLLTLDTRISELTVLLLMEMSYHNNVNLTHKRLVIK